LPDRVELIAIPRSSNDGPADGLQKLKQRHFVAIAGDRGPRLCAVIERLARNHSDVAANRRIVRRDDLLARGAVLGGVVVVLGCVLSLGGYLGRPARRNTKGPWEREACVRTSGSFPLVLHNLEFCRQFIQVEVRRVDFGC